MKNQVIATFKLDLRLYLRLDYLSIGLFFVLYRCRGRKRILQITSKIWPGSKKRKEKENIPRSGAGAGESTYVSDWPLYKDLEFLKDVIKPRR